MVVPSMVRYPILARAGNALANPPTVISSNPHSNDIPAPMPNAPPPIPLTHTPTIIYLVSITPATKLYQITGFHHIPPTHRHTPQKVPVAINKLPACSIHF